MPGASTVARPRQLAFALGHAESLAREDFLPGPSNQTALGLMDGWPDWPAPMVLLIGPEGSGKSHLAALWAERSGARLVAGRSLDLRGLPASLATGALAVEDLADGRFDEKAMFHLINLVREQDASVLITARSSPLGWNVALPDLASRLRAMPQVHLASPDDALLRALIVKLFADRQIEVDEGTVGYLASRIERSFSGARAAVERLDREALQRKRPVTRSLAGELFRGP